MAEFVQPSAGAGRDATAVYALGSSNCNPGLSVGAVNFDKGT
jgi:hypothetical protein